MTKIYQMMVLMHVIVFSFLSECWAQDYTTSKDPSEAVNTYASKMITIIKGPVAKLVSFAVLLACVGALLRGRHRIAVSCGIGFIVLLFVQML